MGSFEDLDIDIPTVAGQPNTCGLAANEIRYTKDFAIALGTNGQYTGDVIVARNWGKDQCYGIGYIQGALHCSEYPGMHKTNFCVKAFGGTLDFTTPNWNHYKLP